MSRPSPSGPLQVFKAEFFKTLGRSVRIRIRGADPG